MKEREYFSCVYQIRDRRYTKVREREKKKDYEIFGEKERKNSEKSLKPIDIQGKCYLPIDYETLRHISEKAVKKTT